MTIDKFTISCRYFTAGEGVTEMIMYCYAKDKDDALERFRHEFGWYFSFADIEEGYSFDSDSAKLLVSERVKKMLLSTSGHVEFYNSLYANYS